LPQFPESWDYIDESPYSIHIYHFKLCFLTLILSSEREGLPACLQKASYQIAFLCHIFFLYSFQLAQDEVNINLEKREEKM
jgi:hypothetical protein